MNHSITVWASSANAVWGHACDRVKGPGEGTVIEEAAFQCDLRN